MEHSMLAETYEEHYSALVKLARVYGSPTPEDTVHDVIASVLERGDQLHRVNRSWLMQAVRYRVIDDLRQRNLCRGFRVLDPVSANDLDMVYDVRLAFETLFDVSVGTAIWDALVGGCSSYELARLYPAHSQTQWAKILRGAIPKIRRFLKDYDLKSDPRSLYK